MHSELHDPRSPTRVSAALRFFLGGASTSSSWGAGTSDDEDDPPSSISLAVRTPSTLSSTLAAGVSGGSALRFAGTSTSGGGMGVRGDMAGSPTACMDGVESGVATADAEFVSGSAWWCAMDCSWRVCCCVWCTGRISSKTTIVQ